MKFKVEIRCYKVVDVEAENCKEAEWIVKKAFASSQSKHAQSTWVLEKAIPLTQIQKTGIFDEVIKMKYDIENDKPEKFDDIIKKIDMLKF